MNHFDHEICSMTANLGLNNYNNNRMKNNISIATSCLQLVEVLVVETP